MAKPNISPEHMDTAPVYEVAAVGPRRWPMGTLDKIIDGDFSLPSRTAALAGLTLFAVGAAGIEATQVIIESLKNRE